MALKYHPDHNKAETAINDFRLVNDAFTFLQKHYIQQKPKFVPSGKEDRYYRFISKNTSKILLPEKYLGNDTIINFMLDDKEYRVVFPAGTSLPKRVSLNNGLSFIVDGE